MLNVRMATSVPDLPGQGGWWAEKAATLTSGAGDASSVFLPGKSEATDADTRQALREAGEAFCAHLGITIKGDNFESSGVLDPSFWLIHPTTDRLFQAAALAFNRHHYGKNSYGNSRLDRAVRERKNNNENDANRGADTRRTTEDGVQEEADVDARHEEAAAAPPVSSAAYHVVQKLEAADLVVEVRITCRID